MSSAPVVNIDPIAFWDDSAPPTRFGGWAFRGPLNVAVKWSTP